MTLTPPPSHAAAPSSVAAAIMQRRADRQRFDSADYAMAQQQQKTQKPNTRTRLPSSGEPTPAPMQLDSSDDFSDWVQCELEPEPESPSASPSASTEGVSAVPPQQVRRIRLQRFDSADWAMQNHYTKNPPPAADTTNTTLANTVAKLRLERHAYTTCSFVSTPIDPPAQHYVKNA